MARASKNRPQAPAPHAARANLPAETVLIVVAWALAAAMTVRLGMSAAGGAFATDECFHAAASQVWRATWSWPVELPQFYSGFLYYYPPLFHVLGAVWTAIFGGTALHVLPTAIYAGTLATVGLAGRRLAPAAALAGTALVFTLHPIFQLYGAKLYVEGFSGLLAVAATLALVAWWLAPSLPRSIAAGLLAGAGLLTKLTALPPVLLLAGAVWVASRPGSTRPARQLGLGLLIALALGAILLTRNRVLYGSAFYPSGAPDLDRALYALNLAHFSTPPAAFYAALPGAVGIPLGLVTIAALASIAVRRRFGIWEAAFALSILAVLAAPRVPYLQTRHLLPFLAVGALAGLAMVFEWLGSQAAWRAAALVVLLVPAALAHADLRDPRAASDAPEWMLTSFATLRPRLKPTDLVLSLWTYDTAWYTGARATWPNPWGQHPDRRPIAMFRETDPALFVADLRAVGIDWVLMPAQVQGKEFNSANYPPSFARCVNQAVIAKQIGPAWNVGPLYLIKVPKP